MLNRFKFSQFVDSFRSSGAVTRTAATYRRFSARFDAAVEAGLARSVAVVENSDVGRHPRVSGWLVRLRGQDGETGAAIVAQGRGDQPLSGPPEIAGSVTRWVSAGARMGFVGVLVAALWWSWPDAEATSAAGLRADLTPTPTATTPSLAIINPANMLGTEAGAAQPALSAGENERIESDGSQAVAEQPPMVKMVAALPESTAGPLDLLAAGLAEAGEIAAAPLEKETAAAQPVPPTATLEPEPTYDVPFVELLPAVGLKVTSTPAPPTPTALPAPPTPTPAPVVSSPGRLWSNFAPVMGADSDHFWMERPFPPSVSQQLDSPSYQFGATAGARYRIHHGIDISNPMGTPVRAATVGEVVHAGLDDPQLLGPYNNFYGNAVVIRLDRRLPVAGGELDIFLLYGHLSEVYVQPGQRVGVDDLVGAVGMTGIAIGPHLHVEVRLGANTYQNSVNPYLWVRPLDNGGAVALRLLTADGRTWSGARVTLARFEEGKAVWGRMIETYIDAESIGPDPAWGENGAMGNVPPGFYYIVGNVNGEAVRAEFVVNAGQTTFVEIRTRQ